MKKIVALILSLAFMMSCASCTANPEETSSVSSGSSEASEGTTTSIEEDTGNSLASIKLTKESRSWSNTDPQYKELLDKYGTYTCNGAVVVATDNDIVYLYAEDAVEKDGNTLVSQDTVFDIASMSKVFTAVLILKLQEEGKLDIEDTLDKYFPEYEAGKKIKLYNLLHMNSGISDYMNNPDPFWNISGADAANKKISDLLNDRVTDEEFLNALYQAPLEFEPGAKFSYSNTNYRLLAFIIEKLTGVKYCEYVKEQIFDVCGMTKTTSMETDDLTYVPIGFDDLVQYDFTDENGYIHCPNNTRGDAGIHSCLTDVLAFDRALFGGKLLSEKSMEMLLTEESGYCLGLKKDPQGYSHDGSAPTCSGNNKITLSEEFGHVYVISLEHIGSASEEAKSYKMPEFLSGTAFESGVFQNGVYTNKYAGLRVNIPEGMEYVSEKDVLSSNEYFLEEVTDEKDKKMLSNLFTDASFFNRSLETGFESAFLNVRLGVPGDEDYKEDEFLTDQVALYKMINEKHGMGLEEKERSKVTLCGREYLRAKIEMTDTDGAKGYMNFYAGKIDEDIMSLFTISSWSDAAPEDLESYFTEDKGPADIKDPMEGTKYVKGVFENGIYSNDYLGLKINIPESYEQIEDSLIQDNSDILASCKEEKDLKRESATRIDCGFFHIDGSVIKENIFIKFVNTKIAGSGDPYDEDIFLDDYVAWDYLDQQKSGGWKIGAREKVEIAGREFTRQTLTGTEIHLDIPRTDFVYAGKVDDDLMAVIVVIAFYDGADPGEYEKMFSKK